MRLVLAFCGGVRPPISGYIRILPLAVSRCVFPWGEVRNPEKPEQGETRARRNQRKPPPISGYIRILPLVLSRCVFPWGREKPRARRNQSTPWVYGGSVCGNRPDFRFQVSGFWFAGLPPGGFWRDTPFYFLCVLSLAVWGERVWTHAPVQIPGGRGPAVVTGVTLGAFLFILRGKTSCHSVVTGTPLE